MQAKPASVAEYNYKARKTRHSTLRRRHDVVNQSHNWLSGCRFQCW